MKEEYTKEQLKPHGILVDGVPELFPPFGFRKQWKVAETFRYIAAAGWLVIIPEDLLSDLASIPKFLRSIFGVNKRETVAAVIHDFGYRNKNVMLLNVLTGECRSLKRKEWDKILNHVMALGMTKAIRRDAIYTGVKWFGGWTWRKR